MFVANEFILPFSLPPQPLHLSWPCDSPPAHKVSSEYSLHTCLPFPDWITSVPSYVWISSAVMFKVFSQSGACWRLQLKPVYLRQLNQSVCSKDLWPLVTCESSPQCLNRMFPLMGPKSDCFMTITNPWIWSFEPDWDKCHTGSKTEANLCFSCSDLSLNSHLIHSSSPFSSVEAEEKQTWRTAAVEGQRGFKPHKL